MSDLFALLVMLACAVSIGGAVAFVDWALRHLKARWARLQASDDTFGNAAYGDEPFVPADAIKLFHSACVTEGGQPNNGA